MASADEPRARTPWSADALPRSLSRVRWRLGQALLPEHFFRQEFGLRQEWELRFAQLTPASWGVGMIEWDEALIERGFAKVTRLMMVFPRGHIVHIPGNSTPVHCNLKNAPGVDVTVYAHLLSAPDTVRDDEAAGDAAGLELFLQKVELTTERGHPGALESLPLANFHRSPDGVWERTAAFVPPLLLLSSAPAFFRATVDRLQAAVTRWQDVLVTDIETHALATQKVVRAHECLRRSYLVQAFLAGVDGESPFRAEEASALNAVTPAEMYQRLIEFYVDVHTYQEEAHQVPALAGWPYDHGDVARCFGRVLEELDRRTALPRGQVSFVPFEAREGAVVADLPIAAAGAREVYFLLHRRGPAVQDDLRGLKISSPSRLPLVHRLALKGVPLRRVDPVPFRHAFAPEVEFFQLLPGEEWEHVLREGGLASFAEGPLKDGQGYVYWRG